MAAFKLIYGSSNPLCPKSALRTLMGEVARFHSLFEILARELTKAEKYILKRYGH